MIWIILALVGLVALGFLVVYNRLVRQRNRIENAWGQVDVQLRRRYDLIPNLIETVRGYADHEKETFAQVVAARAAAQEAGTVADQAEAETMLGGMLRRLFALAEAYPELRANESFVALQGQLSETEDKIAVARQIYNDTVLTYNNTVETVPSNIVAVTTGFKKRPFLEIGDEARGVPTVSF